MLFNQGSQTYFRKSFQTRASPENDCIYQLTPLPSTSQSVKYRSGRRDFVGMKKEGKIGTWGAISISKSIYKLFLGETFNCGEETGN